MDIEDYDDVTTDDVVEDDEICNYNGIDMQYKEWGDEDRLDPSKFIQRGTRSGFPEEFYFDEVEREE